LKNEWTMPVLPEAFVLLWREARYVDDLVAWLARPVAEIRAAAKYLRMAGCNLAVKELSKEKAQDKRLVRAWQGARTREGVALELGWPIQRVLRVAKRLRRMGVNIKPLPHHAGYKGIQAN
jgi:hypothetical protein